MGKYSPEFGAMIDCSKRTAKDSRVIHSNLARLILKRENKIRRSLPDRVFDRIVDNYIDHLNT